MRLPTHFAASVLMVPVLTMTTAMMMWEATMAIECVLRGPGAITADSLSVLYFCYYNTPAVYACVYVKERESE